VFSEFYTSRILLRAKSCKYSSTIKFQTIRKKKKLTSMQLLVMTKQKHIDLRSLLRLQKPVVENRRENYMTYLFSWSEARRPRQWVWISNDGSYCSLSWSLRLRLFLAISEFLAAAGSFGMHAKQWGFDYRSFVLYGFNGPFLLKAPWKRLDFFLQLSKAQGVCDWHQIWQFMLLFMK
jgi:hypothetical protein